MNINSYLTSLLTWYPVIPAAILCLLPMKNQMKYSLGHTIRIMSVTLLILLPLTALAETCFHTPYNSLTPVVVIVCFTVFCLSVKAHFSKSLSVFALVCALTGFLANFANAFDATIHPTSGINDFSPEAALFQAVLTTVFAGLLWPVMSRYWVTLIDSFHLHGVWYASSVVSLIFLIYNLLLVPRHYETLHVHNVLLFYWIAMPLLLILLLLLCVLFYFIVSGMIESSKKENELHILEMQRAQFYKQQQYLEATARERHDFKHAVRTIRSLSSAGSIEELNRFLDEYIEKMPELSLREYCAIPAINAVLNYYREAARMDGIPLSIDITLPEDRVLKETEICSILGNILENAINACREIESYKRFIRLTVTVVNDCFLCIAAVNSFNGKPHVRNGKYVSSRHAGSGIGLESITSIAASTGGSADFSHEGCEFFSNVMLMLP
ncbi:MAG: sensor histidine kinase [Lachnospiraceae bacterium]|nr:sensor histidine kinase [Lachnospiraceae bacterium]